MLAALSAFIAEPILTTEAAVFTLMGAAVVLAVLHDALGRVPVEG